VVRRRRRHGGGIYTPALGVGGPAGLWATGSGRSLPPRLSGGSARANSFSGEMSCLSATP
jgi:hypothetical protein